MAIRFFADEISYHLKHKTVLKRWIKDCAALEKRACGNINIIFVSDKRLLEINNQFLSHDYFTDIITFDQSTEKTISGELYISLDRIKDNATKMQVEIENELYRVIIHGVMHLCGYADKSKDEKISMTNLENKYLNKLVIE